MEAFSLATKALNEVFVRVFECVNEALRRPRYLHPGRAMARRFYCRLRDIPLRESFFPDELGETGRTESRIAVQGAGLSPVGERAENVRQSEQPALHTRGAAE